MRDGLMIGGIPLLPAAALIAATLVLATGVLRRDAGADEAVLAALARRAAVGNDAFIRGDMRRWYATVSPIAADFTLLQPFGGVSHGFDGSDERLDRMARTFTGGTATFDLIASHGGHDLAVLVFLERQSAIVGGVAEQDWSLRVTQVYRRRGDAWEIVHRHADPLVNGIGLERTAALARSD